MLYSKINIFSDNHITQDDNTERVLHTYAMRVFLWLHCIRHIEHMRLLVCVHLFDLKTMENNWQ